MAEVQGADEQDDARVDLDGLVALAEAVLDAEGVAANTEVSSTLRTGARTARPTC